MRHLLSATLLAAVLLPATAAFAQPSAVDPSDTSDAPHNHDWNDVSHINGQLVPVGESNSYLKKFRRTNISTNPIGLILGDYGLSVSYAINNHIAIRGDVNYYDVVDSDLKGSELGIGLPLYLRRTYQGAFIEPGIITRTTNSGYCASSSGGVDDSSCTHTTAGPEMLFGWHWTWDSGFNVAFAFGAGRDLNHDASNGDSPVFANGYFRVGYAF